MTPRYKLSLYVTPESSGKALSDLYRALDRLAYNDYQLNIIDVIEKPEQSVGAGIVGTPTLVYHAADGDKLIDTLSDTQMVREALGITSLT